jgi:hypothetical protein
MIIDSRLSGELMARTRACSSTEDLGIAKQTQMISTDSAQTVDVSRVTPVSAAHGTVFVRR